MSGTADRSPMYDTVEGQRLARVRADGWRVWGPYLAGRQWGTVREDYSADGDAWTYITHEAARSRAYRWGEDGIAGFSDEHQRWCLSLALWNEKDAILKERFFGLDNAQGNHGEDVKELWWDIEATPTHSYQSVLYRYPQYAFPYDELIAENARRKSDGPGHPEYELEDTGIFDDGRWFDITVEYAKASAADILMCVTVVNHGPEAARLHLLPQLVARNVWSWDGTTEKPRIEPHGAGSVRATHPDMTPVILSAFQPVDWLFCENETNLKRVFGQGPDGAFKDAINDHVTGGGTLPLPGAGTKCAAHCAMELQPGESRKLRYRLAPEPAQAMDEAAFDGVVSQRIAETDAFYDVVQADIAGADRRLVQRRALAGLLWSKQVYRYDVKRWLDGDSAQPPPPPARRRGRNSDWTHLANADVILMPDTWEYPWYASWDLAFHAMTVAIVDPDLAKEQLLLLTRDWYMHPSGQLPAYEWSFGDANPPMQAFAALRIYRMDAELTGRMDRPFLERMFHKLMINFTWWVNRRDAEGRNLFQGGFLGLDNIEVLDRSRPVPGGGYFEQSDGTAWMAMYALNLMRMALELAKTDEAYEDVATKFYEHFLAIASAMTHVGSPESEKDMAGSGLWDETDGFFYDALVLPDGTQSVLRLRSLVGLIPLCAVEVFETGLAERHPHFARRVEWLQANRPDLTRLVSRYGEPGKDDRTLLSLLRRHRMKALLARMLDESEFLSPFGIRSLSKVYGATPFTFDHNGQRAVVDYEPGLSTDAIFGGNSNWRGPVWMPLNFMLIEALAEFQRFYGDEFVAECPTGSGRTITLAQMVDELTDRLCALFLPGPNGVRPALAGTRFSTGPEGRDLILFNEFFHGDTGKGLGASHQTGWTALVALLLKPRKERRIA